MKITPQEHIIKECLAMLKPDGKLIISVPIETGLTAIWKNFLRTLSGETHARNIHEIWLAFRSKRIERAIKEGYMSSHVGFKYQDLENLFLRLTIRPEKQITSPFPLLPKWLNSQIYFVIKQLK